MWFDEFLKRFSTCETNADFKKLTTVKTGGKAKVLFRPTCENDIAAVIKFSHDNGAPIFVIGGGSNCLAADEGYDGIVLKLSPYFSQIDFCGEVVKAGAGARTAMLYSFCLANELGGCEFLANIPGTVGGATVMNAGCFGSCIADVVTGADAVSEKDGKFTHLERDELKFSERRSVFSDGEYVVTAVYFSFSHSGKKEIIKKYNDIALAKRASQPLDKPSFGSVFKRTETGSAAVLIDALAFKGFSINGAKVSGKHAGFFINEKNATTDDFLTLIDIVGQKVRDRYGIILSPEVVYVGNQDDLGRLPYAHFL